MGLITGGLIYTTCAVVFYTWLFKSAVEMPEEYAEMEARLDSERRPYAIENTQIHSIHYPAA